jgi:hypothetical protein
MTTRHRIVFQLLVAAFLLGVIARPAPLWACSCIMPSPPPQALQETDFVFTGQVTNVINPSQIPGLGLIGQWYTTWTQSPPTANFNMEHASFAVIDSWKGVETSTVTVYTAGNDGMCGIGFITGQQYLVYGYRDEGGAIQANICSRTTDISNAGTDLAYLNTQPTLTLNPAPLPILPIVVGVGLLIVLGAAGFWVMRRSNAKSTSRAE